jgi:molybdopterin-guanine dinucleotide biosynthesis protein A
MGPRVEHPGRSPAADATGLVLAGGGSTRFGSDKLAAPLRGAPLLHHALRRMARVCATVVVVIAPDAPEPDLPAGLGVVVARDAVEGGGPLAGVAAGLRRVRTEWTVVAGGDMPDLSADVLAKMLNEARDSDAGAVALLDADRLRPLPAVLRTRPALEAAGSFPPGPGASVRALLGRLGAVGVAEERWTALDPSRGTLHDVDEPGDLETGGGPSGTR